MTEGTALAWNGQMKIGIQSIDEDHRQLVEAFNAMMAAPGPALILLCRRAIELCANHFAREEAMMVRVGYDAYAPHRAEHQRLLAELKAVLAQVEAGDLQRIYFEEILPRWFTNHRNSMDYVAVAFARQAGFTG